ncbi:MAG: biotin-dependent carboxyltransferase family protein [Bacteroidota bacterium]
MIEFLNAGLQTTIQDAGRTLHRSRGVPVSGAMDQHAFRFANFLLRNDPDTPVFEFTQQGPKLFFHARTHAVLTGGLYDVQLNGESVPYATPFFIPAKSELHIKHLREGNYGYLSIENGFHAHQVLGSASYCPTVNEAAKCKKGGNYVFVRTTRDYEQKYAQVSSGFAKQQQTEVTVYPGPEFDLLSSEAQSALRTSILSVSPHSSRMAIQLHHELDCGAKDILTAPVQPGTVQLTPGGDMIVLMRDAQTTGGYARILQLTDEGINNIAQCGVNKQLTLSLIQ